VKKGSITFCSGTIVVEGKVTAEKKRGHGEAKRRHMRKKTVATQPRTSIDDCGKLVLTRTLIGGVDAPGRKEAAEGRKRKLVSFQSRYFADLRAKAWRIQGGVDRGGV